MAHNVYIDESIRDSYILCAVSVPTGQVTVARSQIRRLREPGRTSIHMQKETRTRQLQISTQIGQIPFGVILIQVSMAGETDLSARLKALEAVFTHPSTLGSQLVTFDTSNSINQDKRLLASIKSRFGVSVPHFRHIKYTHEPLLWLPDIVAWCYGRGGPWRDAVEPLVDEVIEI